MAQTAAELLDYYRNALSPIATHAALQSQLAERDAAIRQQQAQRAQALQDQLTYAAQIDQYQRQAAAKHAIDTLNTELMKTGLQTQGSIAQALLTTKAETERARALAGIAQQSQIAGEKRKTEQLGGEAANLQRFQDLSRDRLNQLRTSLENTLTPPDAALSKAAVEAATTAGETDKAMLASIAANPANLDSIKDRGKRDAAKEAYATSVEKYQKLASQTPEARALARQLQDEGTNYQALSQQFAQTAGFLTPERQAQLTSLEPANAFSPNATTAPSQGGQPDFNAVLAAAREAAAAQQKQQQAAPTAVAITQPPTTPASFLSNLLPSGGFYNPGSLVNTHLPSLPSFNQMAAGSAALGFTPGALYSSIQEARTTPALKSFLADFPYGSSPPTQVATTSPIIQANALNAAAQTRANNGSAATLAGVISGATPQATKKKR